MAWQMKSPPWYTVQRAVLIAFLPCVAAFLSPLAAPLGHAVSANANFRCRVRCPAAEGDQDHARALFTEISVSDRRSVLRLGGSAIINSVVFPAIAAEKMPSNFVRAANFPRLAPGFKVGNAASGVICECFVDFCCPYSRKMFKVLWPMTSDFGSKMQFVFHNVIQPWHHQSLWLHESVFAVKFLYPEAESCYWMALSAESPKYYDAEIYSLTRAEFYDKIAGFGADVIVGDRSDLKRNDVKKRILQYLIPPTQRGGNFPEEASVTFGSRPDDDENALFPMTRQVVKFQRKRGVHVTPTVFFNGIEQMQISSSWSKDEWYAFLNEASL